MDRKRAGPGLGLVRDVDAAEKNSAQGRGRGRGRPDPVGIRTNGAGSGALIFASTQCPLRRIW